MKRTRCVGVSAAAGVVLAWCGAAAAQCGGGGGGVSMDMKKIMMNMKTLTVDLVDADSKMGEKKPDAKEAKAFQSGAAKMAFLNNQLYKCLNTDMHRMADKKLQKGINDLNKQAKSKDSAGIHDGVSQIRAACSSCHPDREL